LGVKPDTIFPDGNSISIVAGGAAVS
jgi:hypothetical protein